MNPREEIKKIAPTLSQWNHNEGYLVPSNYFDKLSNNVINRVEETEKLEPYFESLHDRVMNKVKEEEKRKVIPISSFYKYGIAAAILITAGTMLWTNLKEETIVPTYSMTENVEDLDYIVNEISMEDIFDSEFIDDESLDEIFGSGEDLISSDDSIEDLLFEGGDELLEELL